MGSLVPGRHITDEVIEVELGDVFPVSLEGRGTAGYSWRLGSRLEQEGVLELVDQESKPLTELAGAPTQYRFRFRARAEGETTVRFVYGRPWEATPTQERTVVVRIRQRPEGSEC